MRVALLLALSFILSACVKAPANRDVVKNVELTSQDTGAEPEVVDADEVLSGLATVKSSKFLGVIPGVFEYEIFDETVLARDLERVERYYRARGYYEAKVTAARVIRDEPGKPFVRVLIRVREGSPVTTKSVRIAGIEHLPFDVATSALQARKLEPGQVFDEKAFDDTKKAIVQALADRGYAFVKVTGKADVDVARHEAQVAFDVEPGPLASYGPVRITGLLEIPEDRVRANLLIEEGEPYSHADIRDARSALTELGVFASVEVRQDTSRPDTRTVPVHVIVRESALRAVRLGGGVRADSIRITNHLRAGWEDRNFLGGLRQFSIETRPGVTYYPASFTRPRAPTRLLLENRVRTELRQRAFVEGRTTGFIGGEYNLYPLLYDLTPPPGQPDPDPDQQPIVGYHEVRARTGLERAFFNHHLYVTLSYNWQANFAFMYQSPSGGLPPGLEDPVRVSFPELLTIVDLRDDRIHPKSGVYVSNSLQVAGYVFLGTVSDVRIRPEVRLYHSVLRKKITLATRATVGLLFPGDYGETLAQGASVDTQSRQAVEDQHKLLFRAFYSGGDISNRGYSYRGVGPHGPVGFLVPTGLDCREERNLPGCTRPTGGLTLWEASFEVRFPISGPLTMVTFADASDVTRKQANFRFDVPHLSVGPGIRYDTPVGPLRFDIGYRVPGMQKIGARELPENEGQANEPFGIKWLDVAFHLNFGEAF
ncbi:MAG TPA: POTRA domain-containing protein [Polyangiaceae bacterium]|nr:POTRA domain-containing protein [Polyangiaceae bacterium]